MATGVSESESQPSVKLVSEAPFTSKIKEHNLAKDKIVKAKLKEVITENDNPVYHDKFIETLVKKGYDADELNQEKANILEGKKLIKENTTKAYEPMGVPRDEVKRNYDLGRGFLLTGKNDEAIDAFTKSLSQLPPEQIQTTKKLVTQPGNDAAIYSEQATKIEADKNPASQLYGIGLAYLNKNDDTNASNFFIQALKQDPTDANAMLGLANVFEKQGNKDEVIRLTNQAAQEYKKEGLALQSEAELTADKEKQRQADQMNDIANGLEEFIKGDPSDKLGVLGKMTPWGFVIHNAKEMAGGVVTGLETMGEGAKKIFKEEMGKGLLEMGVGAGRTIFSAIPQIAVFNSAIQPINEAAQANPDNKTLQVLAAIPEKLFAPATAIAEAIGEKPKEGTTGALALEAADLIAVLAGGALLHKKAGEIKDAKSAIDELQDLSKNAQNEFKQEQTKKQTEAFVNAINAITASELKKEAEKQGKINLAKAIDEKLDQVRSKRKELGVIDPTYVDDMPLNVVTAFDRIDKKIPIDPVLLDEASGYLYDKYNKLSAEKENPNRIQSVGDIEAIQEQLGKDIATIEDYKSFQRDVETPLSEWQKQAEELKADIENPNIKDKAPIQAKLDEVNKTIDILETAEKGKEIELHASELEKNKTEAKIASLEDDLKAATTETAKEVIKEQIKKLTPKEIAAERTKQRETIKEEVKAIPELEDKKRADYKAKEKNLEFSNEEELTRYIAEESESPLEIAEEYTRISSKDKKLPSFKDKVFEENFVKISPKDYEHITGFTEKDLTKEGKKYIDENAIPIDVKIKEINEQYELDLTEQDFIDYIQGKEKTAATPKEIELKTKLRGKYKELTGGIELTPSSAARVIEQHLKERVKNYEKFIDQEFKTAEEARAAYEEAFRTGDLAVEGGEVVTTPESYARPTKIKASEDIKSKFSEAMDLEKKIKEETDMAKRRELKRQNEKLRKENPGLAAIMNKFSSITNKLAELKTKEGESLIEKSKECP